METTDENCDLLQGRVSCEENNALPVYFRDTDPTRSNAVLLLARKQHVIIEITGVEPRKQNSRPGTDPAFDLGLGEFSKTAQRHWRRITLKLAGF